MFTLGASGQIQIAKARKAGLFSMTLLDVEVELHCAYLDVEGGELDTAWLSQLLRDVLDPLHQQALDEHPAFAPRGMSTARFSRYVCNALLKVCREMLKELDGGFVRVVVREAPPNTWAGYTGKLKESRAS
jgi:hypothetical protein